MTGQPARHHIIESRCNQAARELLQHWRDWPFLSAVLTGAGGSGKSSLGQRFAAQSGGFFVDDADSAEDAQLFHQWNNAQSQTRPILFASSKPLANWEVKLPDLLSRLNASQSIAIDPPDDALCTALLQQQLARRGTAIGDALAQFATARLERSYGAIITLAASLHIRSLEQKRAIGQKMIRETLQTVFGAIHEPD